MKFGSALAVYFLFWFLTLFVVLPFGVRTTREQGADPVPGEADSAPHNPLLLRKALWTTLISAVLFALFYANYSHSWVTLDDIPGWSRRPPSG